MIPEPIYNFFQSRLLVKSVTYFIVAAGLPILFFSGVALYLINLSHTSDVSALELQLIGQKIEEVGKFLADTQGLLELNVSTDASYINSEDQGFLLRGIMESNPAFVELSFLNLEGRETEKLSRSQSDEELAFLDLSRLPHIDIAERGQNYISEVYYTLDGPMVSMMSPVKNRNGSIIQLISAEVSLRQIVESVERSRLGLSGYLYLADGAGRYLSTGSSRGLLPGSDLLKYERIKRVITGGIVTGVEPEDRYYNFFNGEAVVGAGRRIPSLGWAIFAEWPISDADAVVAGIRETAIRFTLLSILIVFLMAPLFSYQLVGPIQRLEAASVEVGKGNLDADISIKTNDELEDLGAAFNEMIKGLKRLRELRDEFVFVASHELRSPVTIIRNALEMFITQVGDKIPDDSKQLLALVNQANSNLAQLVNELLDIARSEAGRLQIDMAPCDLQADLLSIIELEKPVTVEKNVKISYEMSPDLPRVMADSGRLREITTNLITNAIKYNRDGGQITVSHEIVDDTVITHVEDTGFGIPEEEQGRVFEKFFRSEDLRAKGITGTGLGLFIVKQLVEKMGGKIWFKSEAGRGSTFSFSLKRV